MNSPTLRLLAAGLACSLLGPCTPAAAHESPAAPGPSACLHPAAWTSLEGKEPRPAVASQVISEMARKDVVLLGEHHDHEDDHHWQLQALAALYAQRPDLVIGFEMFPRRIQPVLDRWIQGELTPKQFIAETEWDTVWNVPAQLYMPLFQFARINRIPIVALNVDNKLNKAIIEKGWEQVPEADREGVGRPAPPPEAYREFLQKIYRQHRQMAKNQSEAAVEDQNSGFERFVESQTTWDRAMAEALARQNVAGKGPARPLVVGIMGSGHIRYGHGVPHQLEALGIKNVGTLLPMPAESDCKDIAGLADAVFALPRSAVAQPEPPRLGVRLEQGQDGVHIAEVITDSLAEKSGLKSGDHLVEIGGLPADRLALVTTSIRQQPHGSWLPLRVKRGNETLELVVKFPSKP